MPRAGRSTAAGGSLGGPSISDPSGSVRDPRRRGVPVSMSDSRGVVRCGAAGIVICAPTTIERSCASEPSGCSLAVDEQDIVAVHLEADGDVGHDDSPALLRRAGRSSRSKLRELKACTDRTVVPSSALTDGGGSVSFVSGEFFLELVDESRERFHLDLAQFLITTGLVFSIAMELLK